MWRHAVNAHMHVKGVDQGYMIMGPLRGGGELVTLGWMVEATGYCTLRFAAAISGSPSPTLENLRAGTTLIQRSDDASGAFGVPTIAGVGTAIKIPVLELPMSVRLDAGAQYIIVGLNARVDAVDVYLTAWAVVVGPYGQGNTAVRTQ